VISIKSGLRNVTLSYVTNQGHVVKESFDYVVLATPYTVLRQLEFQPSLSLAKQEVIRDSTYVQSTKIIIQFKNTTLIKIPSSRVPAIFHHKGIADGTGGNTLTGTVLGPLYYPTNPIKNDSRGFAVFYVWGRNSQILSAVPDDEISRLIYATINKIHGKEAADSIEIWTSRSWERSENALGAFLMNLPGDNSKYEAMMQSEGRIKFVGDDKSKFHGWQQGAIISAIRAAVEINQPDPNYSFVETFDIESN